MTIASTLARVGRSLSASAGTIVFGMEDGTVSIFGLVFGVAATTSSSIAVIVAGATGAAAAAVSMMAGAYLDAETSGDALLAAQERLKTDLTLDRDAIAAMLPGRLGTAGLPAPLCIALTNAVQNDRDALKGLLIALQASPEEHPNPWEQALWMLTADFFSASIPILPFILLPIAEARIVSAVITILLLVALGIGRARIGRRKVVRTVIETVAMGVAAAFAGVAIGMLIGGGVGG